MKPTTQEDGAVRDSECPKVAYRFSSGWWPLRDSGIVKRRCEAAIRCSVWFGVYVELTQAAFEIAPLLPADVFSVPCGCCRGTLEYDPHPVSLSGVRVPKGTLNIDAHMQQIPGIVLGLNPRVGSKDIEGSRYEIWKPNPLTNAQPYLVGLKVPQQLFPYGMNTLHQTALVSRKLKIVQLAQIDQGHVWHGLG